MRGLNRCRVAALGQRGRAGAGIGDRRRHLPRVRALSQQRQPGLCGESLDHGFSNIEFWAATLRRRWRRCSSFACGGDRTAGDPLFPPWMAALTAYALCPAGLVLLAAARTLGGRVRRGVPKGNVLVCFGRRFFCLRSSCPPCYGCSRPGSPRPVERLFPTGAACCPQWAKP